MRLQFLLLLHAALGSAEVESLEKEGDGCHDGGEDILEGCVLGRYEDDRHEHYEDVGVDAEEVQLNLVVDHFHSEVVVGVELILHVVVHQSHQNRHQHHWCVEAEEGSQGPEFEHDYQLELNGEARVLDFGVQQALASYWVLLILDYFAPLVPQAVDEVDGAEDEVDDDERESLPAHKLEDFPSALSLNGEVNAGDKQVEEVMKSHSRHHDELRALCEGVGEPELRELVHDLPEGEGQRSHNQQNDELHDALEGF